VSEDHVPESSTRRDAAVTDDDIPF
jgi:hypothetical protein